MDKIKNCYILMGITWMVIAVQFKFAEGDFTEKPESLNATLNTTRTFQCQPEMTRISTFWRFNNARIEPADPPEGIEVIPIIGGSVLSVYCSERRNMSTVMCTATLIDHSVIHSDNAILLIQGRLGRVTDLRILSTNSTSIILTWVPPFSLDITGVDLDFNYTIVVHNTNNGINTTFEVISGPGPMDGYVFSPDYPHPSVLFEFYITAVNEMGLEGEPSEPVEGHFIGPVRDIIFSSTETVITVIWSPPDGPLGLSYSYCVTASNASNSAVLDTTCDITTLEFIFAMDNSSPDDLFEIFISPMTNLNYLGEGTSVIVHFSEDSRKDVSTEVVHYTESDVTQPSFNAGSGVNTIIFASLATFAFGAVISLVIVSTIAIAICLKRRRKLAITSTKSDAEIKMKTCDAYDVIKKSKQAKRKSPQPVAIYEEVDL